MISLREGPDLDLAALSALRVCCAFSAQTPDFLARQIAGTRWVVHAYDGERLIGFARALSDGVATAYVGSVMVDPDYRRRGVGRALLAAAAEWGREHGIEKLELHVFPWNEGAIALYEAVGFRREGYRARHYLRDDGYADAILMALDI